MESKVRIILGILFVFFSFYYVECASLPHHFRSVRDVELPPNLNDSVTDLTVTNKDVVSVTLTTVPVTKSSLTTTTRSGDKPNLQITQDKISKDNTTVVDKNINKIETKGDDLAENESVKTSVEETVAAPKEKPIVSRGTVKFQSEHTQSNKENDDTVNKSATGRSLNIDIDKYVSPEFHNKNNVYSLPTSPEIEKYLEAVSQDYSDEVTKPTSPKKSFTSRTTRNEFNFDLTTPQSNIFDPKFQLLVDGIKQNLDEMTANTDQTKPDDTDTTSNYNISKLIDNYNNADNETDVSLETKEYKSVDLKTDKNKGNKDVESGKNVEYESTHLKTHTFGEEPVVNKIPDSQELVDSKPIESQSSVATTTKPTSTTFTPSKKPRFQVSLRNNTIETTAPESEIKPKSIKHFSYESSSLDPLYEAEKVTYTKPAYENAINISKRGSTKFVGASDDSNISTTPKFMDFDNKNFSIPPTATAWTLVSLKDTPGPSTQSTNTSDNSNEQNSQENNLVNISIHPPIKKETTTEFVTSTENYPSTTTKLDKTTFSSSESYDSTTINEEVTDFFDGTTEFTSTNFKVETERTTDNPIEIDTTTYEPTSELPDTTLSPTLSPTLSSTLSTTLSTTLSATTNNEFTTETIEYSTTEQMSTETSTVTELSTETETVLPTEYQSTSDAKLITPKTEAENELLGYTTLKTLNNISEIESTTQVKTTPQRVTSTHPSNSDVHEDELENNFSEVDNDYSDIMKKEKNTTEGNDNDLEIVPIDNNPPRTTWKPKNIEVTTKQMNESTTTIVFKDQKSVVVNGVDVENTTADTTSSTDMLSHDDSTDDSNSGMIAAIAISSVGGVCLILLAGLLLIMRKRQKRVTYGQRCRPVSLDAYSLDNVSVYNSVRRKGALRASKRSYGNPAFDDPVSISHQMNFQSLVKFAENIEGISAEFDEIPQVTARANEVPPGCETKNRYANVIPLPETRVFLKPSDNDPHSDYINANYVTGPKNTRGYYIACQAPMQNTVDDFWRMVWEQQCRVVLMLTNLYENGIEKCADYLPPSEVLDCHRLFGDFQITLKKREVKEKYIISSLQLKNMVSNSWREVTHLWYLGWPERGVPTETNSLIAFLIEARSHLKSASNNNSSDNKTSESTNTYISSAAASASGAPEGGPMVVHCSPGTGRTGTAIACDVAIRDFELTRAVDVPKIVYRVRRDRASAVQTRDQYAFIYKVISLYATKLTGGALDSI